MTRWGLTHLAWALMYHLMNTSRTWERLQFISRFSPDSQIIQSLYTNRSWLILIRNMKETTLIWCKEIRTIVLLVSLNKYHVKRRETKHREIFMVATRFQMENVVLMLLLNAFKSSCTLFFIFLLLFISWLLNYVQFSFIVYILYSDPEFFREWG